MSTRHVIGRLTVEVSAQQVTEGQARQHKIGGWIRSDALWRDISQTLDQLVPADVVLTIPRLELTIEAGSEAAFQAQLRQSIQKAVEQFSRTRDSSVSQIRSTQEHVEQLAWHFLETGALPWHSLRDKATLVAQFLEQLADADHDAFVVALQKQVTIKPAIWLRLVYAIGLEKVRRLVLKYGRFSPEETKWLMETAAVAEQKHGSAIQVHFWRAALLHGIMAQTDTFTFRQVVRQAVGLVDTGKELSVSLPADTANSLPDDEPADESIQSTVFFVQNAGLVLLGQFLPTLFARLNLLDGNAFLDEDARFKAIHILQYLVTGELETYEYDLTLNKLLCDLPFHQPVPRLVPLSETDLAEADQLLTEAIQHWSILRNTSIAGLRETFLQRTGKLSPAEAGGWQLQVERKTVDILLDRLPMGWGYSVVSLPWMPGLIYVEW